VTRCDLCGAAYDDPDDLEAHIYREHGTDLTDWTGEP